MCPRGDMGYYGHPKNDGSFRAKNGMPPSHNCVWVAKSVPETSFEGNWDLAFGSSKEIKTTKCKCNYREATIKGKKYIVHDKCKDCGTPGGKKLLKLTDVRKGFSRSHMDKVKESFNYGNIDPRELTDRN